MSKNNKDSKSELTEASRFSPLMMRVEGLIERAKKKKLYHQNRSGKAFTLLVFLTLQGSFRFALSKTTSKEM